MRSLAIALLAVPALAAEPPLPAKISFNRDIRPIMSDTCFHCHGFDPKTREAGLRLDLRDAAITATEDGVIGIVPGDPAKSEIIARIFDEEDPMPPEKAHKPLTPRQKALFKQWVAEGAPYEPHWAYAPLVKPAPPPNAKHPIDAFIQATLAGHALQPSPLAPAPALLRRLSLDLTGLPPSSSLASTQDPQSAIDSLLASPHFGERMAVWWLDIARFADTVGFHGDQNQRIFPYRDYVINAFNQNKSFDQFTREQLAGDLLPNPTPEQLTATGYNRLNMMTREGGAQPKEYLAKYGAERVRSVAAAWFGSTFGCAECHDHKFDPIKSSDFYELQAFFSDVKQWGVYANYGYTPEPELEGVNNDSPFPPEIQVESPWLKKQHARASAALEQHLAASTRKIAADPKASAAQSLWEKDLAAFLQARPSGWIDCAPASATLLKNNRPAPKRAAVVTATRVAPDKPLGRGESLLVTSAPSPGTFASLRVTLPEDSLDPANLGKSLSIALEIQSPDGRNRKVPLRFGEATAKRPVHRGGSEVPGLESEWRLPKTVSAGQLLHAIWTFNGPVSLKTGDSLLLTLTGDNTLPVAFSLSPLAALDPLQTAAPQTLAILSKPRPSRTTAEQAQVATAFLLSTAHDRPAWDEAHRLAASVRETFEGRAWTMVTQTAAKPLPVRVLPRGNWQDEFGPLVGPATPSFLPGRIESSATRRLTRLDLANWITSPQNPITARAVMNRLWALFFGTGLSAVVDDLGSQGELPSHPELLDWLASEFRDSGWNLKHMVRLIVTSHTYQQITPLQASSSLLANPGLLQSALRNQQAALAIDPANRLLASQNPRRLEAEFVRDNALAIAGLLHLEDIGGPSVKPYQPAGYYAALQFPNRDYLPDTDSRQWRRGLYTHWQRTFLHPMLANFDAPARDECAAARVNSNTPQQALTLLNDPAFVEAARVFAARLLQENKRSSDEARITRAFELALHRAPKPAELQPLTLFLAKQRGYFAANPEDAAKLLQIGLASKPSLDPAELAAWTQFARVLLNAHETITRY